MSKHNTIGKGKSERAVNGGLDKYFTKKYIADYYANIVLERYGKDTQYIEPTAGNGAFLGILPKCRAYDLLSDNPIVEQANVFDLHFNNTDVIIGNPPFGMNASIAQKIFNHIADFNVKAICFILPKTFKKTSMHNKLHLNYHLVFEQDLINKAFSVEGADYNVPCVFQIWEYKAKARVVKSLPKTDWITFTTKDNADIAIRRAGGKAGQILEGIEHSESSTYFIKLNHRSALTALRFMNLAVVDFTAGVRSISKTELINEFNKAMEILIEGEL